jgi:primosomal protein N' (replication factor Y)
MSSSLFAMVAVDQPVDRTYTYEVPEEMARDAKAGARVMVPLGRGNRLVAGTILSLSNEAPKLEGVEENVPAVAEETLLFEGDGSGAKVAETGLKAVAEVLTHVLPLPSDLLRLAEWISSYYCAPIGMTLATMVPAAVKRGTRLPANLMIRLARPEVSAEEQLKGVKVSPKSKKIFEKIHFFLSDAPEGKAEHEVMAHAEIARAVIKRLLSLKLIVAERVVKLPEATPVGANSEFRIQNSELILSADQQVAAEHIDGVLEEGGFAVRLIHGVTGSGKTELYIRAIEKVVAAGKRAIVLVPEISLTPQAVRRFTARFPRVAVLHSGLKDSERHQHYHAIASGWAQVIVGARSAIFAPATDLGLIVVDEEHDPSYKQDNLPKYHGRDVAIRRAQMLGIPILLGSATPALESWHNAHVHANWKLLSLRSRPLGTQMPRVVVVDMKGQAKERRGLHILSTHLEHHLKQCLEQKKQAIFLLNRRGYAHYVMCPRCDWVLMCDNCDATMVVHRKRAGEEGTEALRHKGTEGDGGSGSAAAPLRASLPQSLSASPGPSHRSVRGTVQCHYCLTAMQLPDRCPLCQARLTHLGQGTQRAEDELLRKFPYLRLKRMDSDSMSDLGDYQQTLDAFGAGELDLLIGTQMISKGLDFPNVQLVGVLNSDLAMTIPDFRAAERTFQLICQVAGRAGRTADGGGATVVVQTFQPHEPAIAHACGHDYHGFVKSELPHRQEFGYPPYGRLVRIVLSHKGYSKVHAFAGDLVRLIEALTVKLELPIRITGPFPPPMERLVEMYRVEIILFAESAGPLQRLVGSLRGRGVLGSKQVGVNVDVDPIHML